MYCKGDGACALCCSRAIFDAGDAAQDELARAMGVVFVTFDWLKAKRGFFGAEILCERKENQTRGRGLIYVFWYWDRG